MVPGFVEYNTFDAEAIVAKCYLFQSKLAALVLLSSLHLVDTVKSPHLPCTWGLIWYFPPLSPSLFPPSDVTTTYPWLISITTVLVYLNRDNIWSQNLTLICILYSTLIKLKTEGNLTTYICMLSHELLAGYERVCMLR